MATSASIAPLYSNIQHRLVVNSIPITCSSATYFACGLWILGQYLQILSISCLHCMYMSCRMLLVHPMCTCFGYSGTTAHVMHTYDGSILLVATPTWLVTRHLLLIPNQCQPIPNCQISIVIAPLPLTPYPELPNTLLCWTAMCSALMMLRHEPVCYCVTAIQCHCTGDLHARSPSWLPPHHSILYISQAQPPYSSFELWIEKACVRASRSLSY